MANTKRVVKALNEALDELLAMPPQELLKVMEDTKGNWGRLIVYAGMAGERARREQDVKNRRAGYFKCDRCGCDIDKDFHCTDSFEIERWCLKCEGKRGKTYQWSQSS